MRKDLNVENPLTEMKKMMDQPIEPKEFKKDNPETTLEAPDESLPISTTVNPTEKIEPPETSEEKA
jgi:hypothetical protein